MHRMIMAFVLLLALLVANAQALVKFDFEQKYFLEFGPEIKDHSLVRQDGVYHLFYIRGFPGVSLGHATSLDLIHWTLEDPVLPVVPGTWDERAIWAPQVIGNAAGGYVMYYTGVNIPSSQQTGIAISNDLYDWFRLPAPVYHPDELTWAEWSPNAFAHGRDPFVFEHQGLYYMINTAKNWFNKGAVACAVSTDLFSWQDTGPMYVHDTWHVLESLQCLQHDGKFHMFFTEETVAGTTYMSSDSLFSGWDPANRRVIDLGHAAEVTPFDGNLIFSRHTTYPKADGTFQFTIRIDTLLWGFGGIPFPNKPWPLAANWTQTSGIAFSVQPTFLNNPILRGDSVEVGFEGLSWLSSYETYQGPLGLGAAGAFQGDGATGSIRSRTFTIVGNSMNLLVGGGNYPNQCYVALIDATTQAALFKETGKNTDAMDRRVWDILALKGTDVYIEVVDNSTAPFGHISVDDIQESYIVIRNGGGGGGGSGDRGVGPLRRAEDIPARGENELFQNSPNPFNPGTDITYYLPERGQVALEIFDVRGKRVRRLASGQEGPGMHTVRWDGTDDRASALSTGIYFYRLQVDGKNIATRKMMLLK